MKRSILLGCILGSTFEMYDFGIYFILVPTLAKVFFPNQHGVTGFLAVYGITLVSCIARPIGGIVYGHFGDRFGRKSTLITSIMIMALPSLLIAILPSYTQIGITAPILLFILRIIQGAAVGGDTPGAMVFASEHANKEKLCSVGSWIIAGANGGITISFLVALLFQTTFGQEFIQHGGWRITFAIGGLLAGLSLYLRKHSSETSDFVKLKSDNEIHQFPLLQLFKQHSKTFLRALAYTSFMAASVGVLIAFMPVYLQHYLKIDASHNLVINLIYNLLVCILTVAIGYLDNRINNKKLLLSSIIILALYALPMFMWFQYSEAAIILALMLSSIPLAAIFATISTNLVKLFNTDIRYSGVALSYNLAFAISGGLAAISSVSLISWLHSLFAPAYYLLAFFVISLVLLIFSRTKSNKNARIA